MVKKFISSDKIWLTLIGLTIILGIVVRTFGLLQGHSFYLDEGDLIVNFRQLSYRELFGPIYFDEQAPPMFLVMGKFLYSNFGYNEIVLRFIPYLAGSLSLIFLFILGRKIFKNYFPAFVAVFFLAFNHKMIFYSQSFKQYPIEMCLGIIVTIFCVTIDFEKLTSRKAFKYGCVSALSFWISYSLAFVLSGFSLVYLLSAVFDKNKEKFKNFVCYVVPVFVGFMVYYFTNLSFVIGNKNLYTFWSRYTGFFPTDLTPIQYIWNDNKFVLIGVVGLSLIGIVRFYMEDKFKLGLIISPIVMTLIAAAMHLYPFGARLILFLFPFFFIVAAKPFDYVSFNNKIYSLIVLVLFAFTLSYFKIDVYKSIIENKNFYRLSTSREFMKQLKKAGVKNDEFVYVGVDANGSINSYDENNEIVDTVLVKEHFIYEPKFGLNASLSRIPKNAVVYFYLSDYLWCRDYSKKMWPWINEHCTILKRVDEKAGTFIKCKTNK